MGVCEGEVGVAKRSLPRQFPAWQNCGGKNWAWKLMFLKKLLEIERKCSDMCGSWVKILCLRVSCVY